MSADLPIIALDAMGGDRAPEEVVAGALLAHADRLGTIVLVGDEKRLRPLLHGVALEIVHAAGEVAMDAQASQAARSASGTSLGEAVDLVQSGRADAVVSAGNSGAFLAIALFRLRRIAGIDRPAIGAVLPARSGPIVLCDAGANVDARPEWIAQFAVMADAYARLGLGIAQPRVGIVSIGEERSKGNTQTLEAAALLDRLALNFIGHVEGKDMFEDFADVVVCDGFIGNVILKTAEGAASYVTHALRAAIADAPPLGKIGAALLRPTFEQLRSSLSYDTYGGAPLLGVRGACIVAHGRSNRNAIRNAIRNAAAFVRNDVVAAIESTLASTVAS